MTAPRRYLAIFAAAITAVLAAAAPPPLNNYVPQAQYCFPQAAVPPGQSPLCPVVPGGISPDPMLAGQKAGYKGIIGAMPAMPSKDVETPFDNYSWQTFVALNWKPEKNNIVIPPKEGLDGTGGPRLWETWERVSQVFGNSPVQAHCSAPLNGELFSMGSNGKGQPVAQNEEYIQAATLKPAIDVLGNFTLYERRVNDVEIAYLQHTGGQKNPAWNLTTYQGQHALATNGGVVNFPATGPSQNGAMEIKAAWRILDPKQHAANVKKYYVMPAVVAVPPDLIDGGKGPICAAVDLGLVAMHIIQKNVVSNNQLLPNWFWTTFEHVDNAPMASNPCDITNPGACGNLNKTACPLTAQPGPGYSYFDAKAMPAQTNFPPSPGPGGAFHWNSTIPYAKAYLQPVPGLAIHAGSQITRCWQIYKLTQQINAQWQAQLRAVGSVFANYMLIGTQWGGNIEPSEKNIGPLDAVPNYLSNSVVETYLQTFYTPGKNYSPFTTGSCIDCHSAATLVAKNGPQPVSANFSFLPGLVTPGLIRTLPTHRQNPAPK